MFFLISFIYLRSYVFFFFLCLCRALSVQTLIFFLFSFDPICLPQTSHHTKAWRFDWNLPLTHNSNIFPQRIFPFFLGVVRSFSLHHAARTFSHIFSHFLVHFLRPATLVPIFCVQIFLSQLLFFLYHSLY